METQQSSQPEPLILLSLDGGGIRGVSTLCILHEIMLRLQSDLNLDKLPKPCDYFHLIGGTSTGGLIALMLGRLKMSTKEAIDSYAFLAGKIFGNENRKGQALVGFLDRLNAEKGTFKATTFVNEIKNVLSSIGVNPDARMMDDIRIGQCKLPNTSDNPAKSHTTDAGNDTSLARPEKGKAFVCALSSINTTFPRLFRTYPVRSNPSANCMIWEAARATTAAPTYFKPIDIAQEYGGKDTFTPWSQAYVEKNDLDAFKKASPR
ncbi:FabD/lysophospholipase-like protein [Ascobolus immersus RN42]|uniref:FabD/lysophospholipase-like protein n=1 Tax=Ascobolus immersus RN42 TaxID=1160509 RepID=A0A3N4IA72_ASCIM|nr:FabD/lysophospholipase-like protein [Ascobolus immersus RN42]